MSGRSAQLAVRIGSIHQLSAAVSAMRAVAAARAREAEARLDGVRAHAAGVAQALGEALSHLPEPDRPPDRPPVRAAGGAPAQGHLAIVICAEQGFVGAFDDRVLDAACAEAPDQAMLIGERALDAARARGLPVEWSAAMAAHADQAAPLADRAAEALVSREAAGRAARVTLVHALPGPGSLRIARRALIPFDYARFPPPPHPGRARLTLPPERLVARLAEEYVFAELCEAIVLSFAAENAARMRAMAAAAGNVARELDALTAESRRLRQSEITDEILEIVAGAAASRPRRAPVQAGRAWGAGAPASSSLTAPFIKATVR